MGAPRFERFPGGKFQGPPINAFCPAVDWARSKLAGEFPRIQFEFFISKICFGNNIKNAMTENEKVKESSKTAFHIFRLLNLRMSVNFSIDNPVSFHELQESL